MVRSLYREARAVGSVADAKIKKLQSMYLNPSQGAPARAVLAQLRHGRGSGNWISEGSILFQNLDDPRLGECDEPRMLKALKTAMELYAWHQQSREEPMAFSAREGETNRSFGRSCRLIESDLDSAAGVRRKLAAVESSLCLNEMEHQLRSLIQLMRANNVQVDYRDLATDLYLIQFEMAREGVFMRWSRDYYAAPTVQNNQDKTN